MERVDGHADLAPAFAETAARAAAEHGRDDVAVVFWIEAASGSGGRPTMARKAPIAWTSV